MYRTAPLFAIYFQEKEGGGRNNKDLRFRLAVKPPPHLPRIRVLCSAVEDERHAVAVLKEGARSCWPRTCCHFLQNIAGSLAARLLPPAATAG